MPPDRTKNINDTFSFVHEHEKCINIRDMGLVRWPYLLARNGYRHSVESVK